MVRKGVCVDKKIMYNKNEERKGKGMLIKDISAKMQLKRKNLLEAARYLFIERGITNTSIDAIVKKADVAKGTFYLYFQDKEDILNEIVYSINRAILLKAFKAAKELNEGDFVSKFIFMIDSIINHFADNPEELKLVKKNFSWPVMKEKISAAEGDAELAEALKVMEEQYALEANSEEARNTLFATVEMCGSLCYTCIINKQPTDMETMKPTLYMMIRKILE
jgi:AcrR family transcriptional regulator